MVVLTPEDQSARFLALRDEILTALRPAMAGAPGTSPLTDAAIGAFKLKTLPLIQQQMTLKGLGHSPAVSQVAGETLAMALPEFINADLVNRLNATGQAANLIPAENQVVGTQGQLALGGRAQTLQEQIQPRALSLQEEIQRGQLGLSGRQVALSEQLDPRRVALEEEVGRGQLGLAGTKLAADIANQEAARQMQAAWQAGQLSLGQGDLYARAAQIQQAQQQLALAGFSGAGGLSRDVQQAVADSAQAERLRLQGLAEGSTIGLFGGSVLPPSLISSSRTKQSSSK